MKKRAKLKEETKKKKAIVRKKKLFEKLKKELDPNVIP